jgi:hypothetical protein
MHCLQSHSCAILNNGAVLCWGNNAYGQVIAFAGLRVQRGYVFVPTMCFLQVGDGTAGTDRLTPVGVVGLGSGVTNVALGFVRLFARRVCLCLFGG